MANMRVCVYCASSRQCDPIYHQAAARLGRELALAGHTTVYGGGSVGSMGYLADAALAAGGRVIGVIPSFMHDLEWAHRGLTELLVVNDMHERKRLMIDSVAAVVALPGGCGTFEELFEAITWKRLGAVRRRDCDRQYGRLLPPANRIAGALDRAPLHGRASSGDVEGSGAT